MYTRLFVVFAVLCVLVFAACGETEDGDSSSTGSITSSPLGGGSSTSGSNSDGSNSSSSLAPSILAFDGADFPNGTFNQDVTVGNPPTGNTAAKYATSYYISPNASMNLYSINQLDANCIAYVSPAMVSSAEYSKFSFWIRTGDQGSGTAYAMAIAFGAGEPAPDSPVFYLKNTIQSPYAASEWKTTGGWDFTTGVTNTLTTSSANNNWEKVVIALPVGFDTQGKLMRIRYYGAVGATTKWDYYFDDFCFEL